MAKKGPKPEIPQWTLGDRMRKARELRGIKPGQMAGIMLRDRNTITNYERGNTRPPRNVLDRWAEVTAIPVDWIIGDSNPFGWRTPPPPSRRRRPKSAWITAKELQPKVAA